MKNNKLHTLLATFSKNELKEFDKFLRSPYFMEGRNFRSKILYDYFSLLKNYYPEFKSASLTKEILFSRLYPNKKFNDTLMRRLDSDLGKLAMEFISLKDIKEDKLQSYGSLINTLGHRKLDKLFIKELAAAENLLNDIKYNSNHNYHKHSLILAKNSHAYANADMLKLYDPAAEAETFTAYILCRALEIYRNLENDKAIIKRELDTSFFENILTYLNTNRQLIAENDYLAMHYYEIMLNLNKEDEFYDRLDGIKDKLRDKLSRETLRNMYITLVNYCVRKTNAGNSKFRKRRFTLDMEIMENRIHETGQYYDLNYFLSAVRNAVSLGKIEWAEKFISRYKLMLDPKHSSFAVNFAYGVLYYGSKEFNKALEALSMINIEYSARKQQVKNLMLVIYCETGELESALNIIDASKHLLKADKQIPDGRKRTFTDFLKYTAAYIKLRLYPDKTGAGVLKQKLDRSPYFIYKEWLLNELEELR